MPEFYRNLRDVLSSRETVRLDPKVQSGLKDLARLKNVQAVDERNLAKIQAQMDKGTFGGINNDTNTYNLRIAIQNRRAEILTATMELLPKLEEYRDKLKSVKKSSGEVENKIHDLRSDLQTKVREIESTLGVFAGRELNLAHGLGDHVGADTTLDSEDTRKKKALAKERHSILLVLHEEHRIEKKHD